MERIDIFVEASSSNVVDCFDDPHPIIAVLDHYSNQPFFDWLKSVVQIQVNQLRQPFYRASLQNYDLSGSPARSEFNPLPVAWLRKIHSLSPNRQFLAEFFCCSADQGNGFEKTSVNIQAEARSLR